MRRVISEAEAGEPVTNDLYEGHCGQRSQGIILMQDVYSKKKGSSSVFFISLRINCCQPWGPSIYAFRRNSSLN